MLNWLIWDSFIYHKFKLHLHLVLAEGLTAYLEIIITIYRITVMTQ